MRLRVVTALGCAFLILLGMLGFPPSPAGAASQHYVRMTELLASGVPLSCADVDWAAGQGLIEPIEVRFLSGAGAKCPNEQYEVMLALGSKRQLSCADVEWNAANGMINWNEASGLLWRTPGCVLSKYAFLVALAAQKAANCVDIDWHQKVGLISANQARWLKLSLARQGRYCYIPGLGTQSDPVPLGYPVIVGDWFVLIAAWEPDVSAEVFNYNSINVLAPPGYVFARAWIVARYVGSDVGVPYEIHPFINDQWSNLYQRFMFVMSGSGGNAHNLWQQPSPAPGGIVSGALYYFMPAGSANGPIVCYLQDPRSPITYFRLA